MANKKLKIAFLNKYQGEVARGAETFVEEVGKRLSKKHQVDIVSNINYFKLLRSKYDIIVPTNGRFQVFITRIISWLSGARMIVSGQSGAGLDDRLNLYAFPDVFVALSSYQRSWAKKINPFVATDKIPNGVDLAKFSQKISKRAANSKAVLAVGAFTKEKRHELTIKAVSKLSGVKLIVLGGGGNQREKIEKLGNELLGRERFQTDSVPFKDIPKFYELADLFVFPTVPWESFGIVLTEAMASGLPVVATDDPIRREIVGNAGILVDPTDTDAYANALEKALNTKWGDKPRKQAEKFSWDKIAKEYEKLFLKLANE